MKLKTTSPQALPLGRIVLAALVSFTFFPLGDCANVFTRFYVGLTPDLGGDCSNYPVANIYDEALLMAQAAIDAINNYGSDPVVRAQLQTFFGIVPDDAGDAVSPAQANQLANVQAWYQAVITDQYNTYSTVNNQPSIFCDESWLFATEWQIDQATGLFTGQTVFQASGGMANQIVWSKVHSMLAGITLQCDDNTAGYTKRTPSAITICPASWNSPTRLDSLADYRSDASSIDDGTPLGQFESTPGTLLHEILHLVSGYAIDDIEVTFNGKTGDAYTPEECAALASQNPAMAITNAESYTWFATASYLNLHDWSRTLAGEFVSTSNVRARADGNNTLTTTTTMGGQIGNDLELREMWHESKRKTPRSHRQSSSLVSLEEMTEAR